VSAKKLKWIVLLVSLCFISIAVICLALGSGAIDISVKKVFSIFAEWIRGEPILSSEAAIIMKIRVPRILLAFMVGGALSLAGVILQAMFRNPLVEPYTLGISGGAGLAVSIFVAFGFTMQFGLPVVGFIGAVLAIFLVYTIGRKYGNLNITVLLLTGVMFSFICSSLIMLIMSTVKAEEAHSILFWIMGSLERNNPLLLKIVSTIIPIGLVLSIVRAWDLNALSLGEEEAIHLGIDTAKTKRELLIIASVITGVAVSVSGIIGFVGLVVPHVMRMFVGSDHRMLIPSSFLLGGIFLTVCDTIARSVFAPIELPVGVITGLIGGTLFIYFLVVKPKKI